MAVFHTFGVSDHRVGTLLPRLRKYRINAVADVRSPRSGEITHGAAIQALCRGLKGTGVGYAYLGDTLGERPVDTACYEGGRVDFDKVRATESFLHGVARLRRGALDFRICLLGEHPDPLECHRAWLVSQALHDMGATVRHILSSGDVEVHDALIRRAMLGDPSRRQNGGIVASELMATAHKQGERIAYCVESNRSKNVGK
jgi:hypothetical protein